MGRALLSPDRSRRPRAELRSAAETLSRLLRQALTRGSRATRLFTRSLRLAWKDVSRLIWWWCIVLAAHSTRYTGTALKTGPNGETPLAARSAMICIVTLSALGWAVALLPL